jgi:hypothetical protein
VDDPAIIKAELIARIQAEQKIELQPDLFELEWHQISKKSQQPVEDIVAGGLCVVTNFSQRRKGWQSNVPVETNSWFLPVIHYCRLPPNAH